MPPFLFGPQLAQMAAPAGPVPQVDLPSGFRPPGLMGGAAPTPPQTPGMQFGMPSMGGMGMGMKSPIKTGIDEQGAVGKGGLSGAVKGVEGLQPDANGNWQQPPMPTDIGSGQGGGSTGSFSSWWARNSPSTWFGGPTASPTPAAAPTAAPAATPVADAGAASGGGTGITSGMGAVAAPAAFAAAIGFGKNTEANHANTPFGDTILAGLGPDIAQVWQDPVGMGLPTLLGAPFLTPFTASKEAKAAKPEWSSIYGIGV